MDFKFIQLIKKLVSLKREAEGLGIFTGDRDLLECPNCLLVEDVEIGGTLITYFKNDNSQKDLELRFNKIKTGCSQCPNCNQSIINKM